MFKKILITCVAVVSTWLAAGAWGVLGHDAVAYIAEQHLRPEVKDSLSHYLDGKSIVYYASWMDRVRATQAYKHTNNWHSVGVTDGMKYYKRKNKDGDAVYGLNRELVKLSNRSEYSDSAIAVAIKLVVHMVGDMHCPSHSQYADHSQRFDIKLFGTRVKYHKFWDSVVLETGRRWYYTEFAHQLDNLSEEEEAQLAEGSILEWAEENARDCRLATQWLTAETEVSGGEGWEWMFRCEALAHRQIQKAGIRLAALLNSLF